MNLQILQDILPAFAGAFFAFLFIKLSETLKSLSKRRAESYDALVKTEIMTVDISQQLDSIIFKLKHIISHFNEASEINIDMLSVDKPNQIMYDKSVLDHFLNIDFKNDIFSFFVHIDQNNSSISSLNEFKEKFQNLRIEQKITSENYMINMKRLVDAIKEILERCNELADETLIIEAGCRVLMIHEMTIRMKLKNKLLQNKYNKKHHNLREEQLEIIKREVESIAKKSLK